MTDRQEELRLVMEKHIGGVYKRALESTGSPESARDVTRRVMALLRRTHETGMAVTDDTVKRLTEDCCEEMAYYQEQKAIFKDGVIAGIPDFDTALSSLSEEELREAKRKAEQEAAQLRAEQEAARRRAENEAAEREAEQQRRAAELEAAERAAREEADRRKAEIERKRAELEAMLAPVQPQQMIAREYPAPERQGAAEYAEEPGEEEGFPYPEDEGEEEDGAEGEELIPGRKDSPVPVLALSLLAAALVLLIFCLLMMLMYRGVLPGGQSAFVQSFVNWFNSSLFPLF